MKKLLVALPLSFFTLSAFAFPNAPEYNGILGTAPLNNMNLQNNQLQSELLFFQTGQTNTPADTWQVFGTFITNPVRAQNGNLTQPGYRNNTDAVTIGTDYHGKYDIYGFAVGRTMGTLTYLSNNGSVMLDENMASFFAGYKRYHTYGSIIATYGNIDASNISHNIGAQNFYGQTTGEHFGLDGTAGYNFNFLDKKLRTGPVIDINYQKIKIYGFAETPLVAGPIPTIQYDKQDYQSLVSGAGWQMNYITHYKTTELVPYIKALYDHEFLNTQRNINVGLATLSSSTTTVVPYTPSDNSSFVNVTAGVQAIFSSGLDLTFGYNAAVGQKNLDSQSVMLSASVPVM